ncbi:MAG: redoxin domain-containing protein, partial [Deltaproteobacteria bacterium]|nr:redoxin domain-containing protein [Deltaproteobacteria bacterium]
MLRYTCNGLASLLLIFYGTLYPAVQACAYGHDKTSNMTYLQSFDIATYQGSRLLLFIYSITDSRSGKAIELLNDLYSVRSEFNIDIVGICIDTGKENTVRSYHNSHAAAFPIFIDATGNLYKQLRMSGSVALYLYSKNGDLLGRSFGSYLPPHADLSHVWRIYIDRYINIGFIPSDRPFLGLKPAVPLFSAQTLSGHTINIQDLYKKKPLVIVIFSSTCITCNEELGFLNSLYTNAELGGTFEIVGISRHNREITSRLVQKKKFDFPVIIDTESRYSALFPSFIGPVPISYLIDRQGRIHYVHHNYNTRHNDIYTMELRKLIGKPSEPLLDPEGYSGHDRCVICHEQQHHQWYLTRHAAAINSLKRKGREDDPACIACHVTGYGQTGGYSLQDPAASGHLEGV